MAAKRRKRGRVIPDSAVRRRKPAKPPVLVCSTRKLTASRLRDAQSVSIKLDDKDELFMIPCEKCKRTHYYLAQPITYVSNRFHTPTRIQSPTRFRVFELVQGETILRTHKVPSGDVDTFRVMQELENEVLEHCKG